MNVLVDTSVWSLALRRRHAELTDGEKALTRELADLLRNDRVLMVGPIRQELLSGLRDESQFERLREHLAHFADEPLLTADFEEAARYDNLCRAAGIAGTSIDLLLCAIAQRHGVSIFTTDVTSNDTPDIYHFVFIHPHPVKRRPKHKGRSEPPDVISRREATVSKKTIRLSARRVLDHENDP